MRRLNPKTKTRFTKIYNNWSSILKKAGLDGNPGVDKLRFHDLRHSAASYLAMGNASTLQIAEVLGHKSLQTTKRYAHLSVDSKAALTERLLGNIAVD